MLHYLAATINEFNARYIGHISLQSNSYELENCFSDYTQIDIALFDYYLKLRATERLQVEQKYLERLVEQIIWVWPIFKLAKAASQIQKSICFANKENDDKYRLSHQQFTHQCDANTLELLTYSKVKVYQPEYPLGQLILKQLVQEYLKSESLLHSFTPIICLLLSLYVPQFYCYLFASKGLVRQRRQIVSVSENNHSCTELIEFNSVPRINVKPSHKTQEILELAHEIGHYTHYVCAMDNQGFYAFEPSLAVKETLAFSLESLCLTLISHTIPDLSESLFETYQEQSYDYASLLSNQAKMSALQNNDPKGLKEEYADAYPIARILGQKLALKVLNAKMSSADFSQLFCQGAKLSLGELNKLAS